MAFLVLNDNEEKFAIPNGETVIGRGPYLRVKESILSRSHATISLSNGHLSIKPIHKNPTYFYSANTKENQVQLEKDAWKDLADGDHISLLPNSYKYKIEITCHESTNGNKQKTLTSPRNENVNDDVCMKTILNETQAEGPLKKEDKTSGVRHLCESTITPSKKGKRKLPSWMMETESVVKKKKKTTTTPKKDTQKTKVVHPKSCTVTESDIPPIKNEQLPHSPGHTNEQNPSKHEDGPAKKLSLIETSPQHETCYESKFNPQLEAYPVEEDSFGDVTQDVEADAKPPADDDEQPVPKSSVAEIDQDEHSNDSFSILDDQEDESVKCKEDAVINQDENSNDSFSILDNQEDESVKCKEDTVINQDENSNDSFSILDNQEDESVIKCKEDTVINQDENSNDSFSILDNQEDESVKCKDDSDVSTKKQGSSSDVKACPYGKRCYRKNPAHFTEFSHEDNDDDDTKQENSVDDKTECPYGLKCYRQSNPHHTSKYTHTSIGKERRSRHTRKLREKKKKSVLDKDSDNDGDENEYDLDDSFLASSTDSGGYSDDSDSDYKPYGKVDDDEDEDVDELVSEAKGFLKNKKM